MMSGIHIRGAQQGDLPMIFSAWTRALRVGRPKRFEGHGVVEEGRYVALPKGRAMAPHLWARVLQALVGQMAEEGSVAVAYHPAAPVVVVGWIAFDLDPLDGEGRPALHFVWTRKEFRRQGVARLLLQYAGGLAGQRLRASFMTEAGQQLLQELGGRDA